MLIIRFRNALKGNFLRFKFTNFVRIKLTKNKELKNTKTMKNIKFYVLGFFAITLLSLFFTRCDNNDSTGTARVTVRMTDGPGEDYDEVNVEVLDVLIKNSSDPSDQGWVSIGDETQVGEGKTYDLLKLTGGVNALLADEEVPSGKLGQIRLLLGDDNTVVLAGGDPTKPIPLNTPSAQQSGLKVQVNKTLEEGKTYQFLLDFDVEHSVVKAGGTDNYNLHPVIRVSENTGAIKGSVTPIGVQVLASVQVGTETITAGANVLTGVFQLNGVPAGTYTVTITATGYKDKIIENVKVVNGVITDAGAGSSIALETL